MRPISPTLRAQLEPLVPYLDDPTVTEVLVSRPNQLLVVRGGRASSVSSDLSDAGVRALAARLYRETGRPARPAMPTRRVGRRSSANDAGWLEHGRGSREPRRAQGVVGAFRVFIEGRVRGRIAPVIRLERLPDFAEDLSAWVARGALKQTQMDRLIRASTQGGVLIVGVHRAGKTNFLAAMLRTLGHDLRIALFEEPSGPLVAAGLGHIVMDASDAWAGLRLGADLLAADDPEPALLRGLLECGRPFIATFESGRPDKALARLAALLFARGVPSKGAAKVLLSSSLELLATVGQVAIGPSLAEPHVLSLVEVQPEGGVLRENVRVPSVVAKNVKATLGSPTADRSRPSLSDGAALPPILESEDILPEQLLSRSVVARLGSILPSDDAASSVTLGSEAPVTARAPGQPSFSATEETGEQYIEYSESAITVGQGAEAEEVRPLSRESSPEFGQREPSVSSGPQLFEPDGFTLEAFSAIDEALDEAEEHAEQPVDPNTPSKRQATPGHE